jgi:hypothetical protein
VAGSDSLVEGGVVWVEVGDVTGDADAVVVGGFGFPPPPDDVTVDAGDEPVVPWGVDVDGAVVVELNVGLVVVVLEDSLDVVLVESVVDVEPVLDVVVLIDDEPPVGLQ